MKFKHLSVAFTAEKGIYIISEYDKSYIVKNSPAAFSKTYNATGLDSFSIPRFLQVSI